jgi:hypothetical protein
MKLNYRTERDTEHGSVAEYHNIKEATNIECAVDNTNTYSFISKSYNGEPDEICLHIGGVRVDFPVTMVDAVLENVKLTMEEYNNKLHEEQLEDERSTSVK